MDHINDVPDAEIPAMEQIPDSQNNQNEHEISQNYEGAPETVRNISNSIQFNSKCLFIWEFSQFFLKLSRF